MRAVGSALNKNRDFDSVPCHRVVQSGGEVGGYVFGTSKKIEKLAGEGVKVVAGRVDLKQFGLVV